MQNKKTFITTKYILLLCLLILFPFIFWIYNFLHLYPIDSNEYELGHTLLREFIYTLFLLPYISVKLCEHIAKKHPETSLIKMLSTWSVPIMCLVICFILDMSIDIVDCAFKKVHDISILSLREFSQFVSFSASFIPIFLMGIRYKILMKKDINGFLKNDAWIIFWIIIFSFILKIAGAISFAFVHNGIARFFL